MTQLCHKKHIFERCFIEFELPMTQITDLRKLRHYYITIYKIDKN